MHAVQASGELILERGEGCHLWDEQGNRYVDSTGGLWYANVGYGRAEIADAAAAQMRKLHAYSHYGDVSSRPTTDLAERISAIAPMEDAAVFFTSGGGESIETVVKLVRRYWSLLDQPDRTVIISRERAYHGLAGYGTSIVGTEAFKVGVGPVAGGTARVAWDSAEALEATIAEIGPERVAAFFCEPIIGAGGVLLPPDGYLRAAREICRAHGVLFVADEVICGYGRVGDWFACSRVGLDPDAVTFAKGITSGYVPLGGVIVGRDDPGAVLEHGRGRRLAARLHLLGPRERRGGGSREPRHHRAGRPRRARARARDGDRGRARPAARSRARDARSAVGLRGRRGDPDRPRRCSPTTPALTDRVTLQARDPRRPHPHARRGRTADLAAARHHPRRARRDRVRPCGRARRRRCRALGEGIRPRGSRARDPSDRSCGTPRSRRRAR